MAVVMRAAATDVVEKVIPASGHWLMEEQPVATVAPDSILDFVGILHVSHGRRRGPARAFPSAQLEL